MNIVNKFSTIQARSSVKGDDDNYGKSSKPEPSNLESFMPWACNQLQIETSLLITKTQQNEYVSVAVTDRSKSKGKIKVKPSQIEAPSYLDKEEKSRSFVSSQMPKSDRYVKLFSVYDNCDRLVQIKFHQNKRIPQILMKVLVLTIQFHINLTSIVINRGLDMYTVHELQKLLPLSRITELILDDTYLREANYHILLDMPSCLKHLSLARCKLSDIGLEEIATKLIYPAPASKTLCILNLSSNIITDAGAKYLANSLRSNRQLCYLNLAGNLITDEGAACIFDSCKEFCLTPDELLKKRARQMDYLFRRSEMIKRIYIELVSAEFEKKANRRKSVKPASVATSKKHVKGAELTQSSKTFPERKDFKASIIDFEGILHEKAQIMAESAIGDNDDPYSVNNTFRKEHEIHCYGNNSLCYLNLAYNDLTYFSIKKLLQILLYQQLLSRKPRGLINVIIEGNPLPIVCMELAQINDLLENCIMMQTRMVSAKKKPQSKFSSK